MDGDVVSKNKIRTVLLLLAIVSIAVLFCIISMSGSQTSAAETEDTFESDTVEGVTLTYKVMSIDPSSPFVYVGDGTPIDIGNAEKVTIPSTVTYDSVEFQVKGISENAFYYQSSLTNVSFPSTIITIWAHAFDSTHLKSITLPSNLTYIGKGSFACTDISTLELPDSVSVINDESFSWCSDLKTVSFGSGLGYVGPGAFMNSGVTSFSVSSDNESFSSSDGILLNKEGTSIMLYPASLTGTYTTGTGITSLDSNSFYGCSIEGIVISAEVTEISSNAFSSCYSLASVTINSTSVTIGNYAFSESGITNIVIGDNVTNIGNYAFKECYSLTTASINNTGTVGQYIFYGCTSLTSVSLGDDISGLAGDAFNGCTSMETITVDDNNDLYYVAENVLYAEYDNKTYLIYHPAASIVPFSMPSGIYAIGNYAFADSDITSITIDSQTTAIGKGAFYECSSLSSISIPSSVTLIGANAFAFCTSLEYVNGCSGVTSLESSAFYSCTALKSISLTNTSLTIDSGTDKGVFEKCTSLESVTLPSTLTDIGKNMFNYCSSLTSITIPSAVKEIKASAFEWSGLTSIALPSGLTKIGDYAFYNCRDLASVTGLDTVTSIGKCSFYGCESLESIIFGTVLGKIGEYAFYQSGLTTVSVPDNVTSVGAGCFKYCGDLSTATIGTGVTAIPDELFFGCVSLKGFTINEGILSIGSKAFYGCTNFESLMYNAANCADLAYDACAFEGINGFSATFSATVVSVPNYIFYSTTQKYCVNVISIILGVNVETIGAYSLAACVNLKYLTYCSNAWSGGSIADLLYFAGTNLDEGLTIYIYDNVTSVPKDLFRCTLEDQYKPKITSLYIGKAVTSIGTYAFANNPYLKTVVFAAESCGNMTTSSHLFYDCNTAQMQVAIYTGVKSVPAYLFYESDSTHSANVVTVIICSDVTSIGSYAFYNLRNLTGIGYDAASCGNLTTSSHVFDYCGRNGDGITVYIGENVKVLPAYLFYCNSATVASKIISVEADKSASYTIGSHTFAYSPYLTTLDIGDGCTGIGEKSFHECTALSTVTIGKGLTTMGDEAFSNCTSMTSINFNATKCGALDYNIFENCGTAGDGITVVFGDNVTCVPDKLFDVHHTLATEYYPNIASVTFGSSIQSIGIYAFYKCLHANSMTLPNGLLTIGEYAFYSSDVTSIVIPNSVTTIGEKAFYDNDFTSITIGTGVTNIGSECFYNSPLVAQLQFNAVDCADFTSSDMFYKLGRSTAGTVVSFGSGVSHIPDYMFSSSSTTLSNTVNIKSVLMGNVSSIGDYAFNNCYSLTSITIPANTSSIGYCAFKNCTNISDIYFEAISCIINDTDYPFYNVGTATSGINVSFGDNVVAVPNNLFKSTSSAIVNIKNINYNNVQSIGSKSFSGVPLVNVTLSDKITSIGSYAFSGCTQLATVYIGKQTQIIGEKAFNGCSSLSTINYNAIHCNDLTVTDTFAGSSSSLAVTFCEDVKYIPANLFKSTTALPISSLIIPDNVETIASDALTTCTKLTSLTIGRGVVTLGTLQGLTALTTLNFNAENCNDLGHASNTFSNAGTAGVGITVTFGSFVEYVPANIFYVDSSGIAMKLISCSFDGTSVKDIGDYAFAYCSLTSKTIPEGVETVGDYAMAGDCSANIPSTIKNIGKYAYSGTSLSSVTIPSGMTSIPQGAFYGCESLSTVFIHATVSYIDDSAFGRCTSLTAYSVDDGNKKYSSVNGVLFDNVSNKLISYPSAKNGNEYYVPTGILTLASESFYNCLNLEKLVISDTVTSTSGGAVKGCTGIKYVTIPASITSLTNDDFTDMTFYDSDSSIITDRSELIGYTFKGNTCNELKKQITITFDTKGGSSVDPIIKEAGISVSAPVSPTRTGCEFSKWQLDGEDYAFTVMPDDNITLTAVWLATVTLSYDSGNVSFAYKVGDEESYHTYSAPFTMIADSKLTVIATAEDGYEFVKWKDNNSEETTRVIEPVSGSIALIAVAEYSDPIITVSGATESSGIWTVEYNATGVTISIDHPLIVGKTVEWYKGTEKCSTGTSINVKNTCVKDTYHAVIIITDAYGNITSDDTVVTITKVQLTVTAPTGAKDKTYDGNVTMPTQTIGIVSGIIESDKSSVSIIIDKAEYLSMDASETVAYCVSYKFATESSLDANYIVPVDTTGDGTINKRSVTMTSATDEKIYDGTELTNSNVVADGFIYGQGASYTVTGSQTYVGSSKNTFTYELNEGTLANNYSVNPVEGDLTINAIPTNIVITTSGKEKIYDGTELTESASSFTEGILINGDILTVITDGVITDVGTVDNTIYSYNVMNGETDVTNCYSFGSPVYGKLIVTARPVTMTSATDEKVYDGTELTNSNVVADGFIDGQGASYTVTGTITDFGTVENSFTYKLNEGTKDSNYSITTMEGVLKITKRTVSMTSASDSKVYDKTALTNDNVTADGFIDGQGASYTVIGSQTNVGISDNEFTFEMNDGTKSDNYSVTTIFGKLTVERRVVDVPAELYYKYTGSEITFSIPTSPYYSIEDKTMKGTEVGTYTYKLTIDDNCKWSPESFNGDYNVYITEVKKEHTNSEGKVDVAITGENGIRGDYTLSVAEKTDLSDISSKFSFNGVAKYSYDIKLVKDSKEVQPDGKVTLAMLIPSELRNSEFTVYHIHGDTSTVVEHTSDGDYAAVTVDNLSDFVFVAPTPESGSSNTTIIIVIIVVIAVIIIGVAAFIFIKKRRY